MATTTIERFPNVPVEVWPIEVFTYLQPRQWNGTRSTERMPFLERYWKDADPEYWDGEGAETKPPSRIRPGSFRPAARP